MWDGHRAVKTGVLVTKLGVMCGTEEEKPRSVETYLSPQRL